LLPFSPAGEKVPEGRMRAPGREAAERNYTLTPRSLNAFAITDTELKLIAAAAIIGLSRTPKNG
jgi:hypothetical protein